MKALSSSMPAISPDFLKAKTMNHVQTATAKILRWDILALVAPLSIYVTALALAATLS